MTHLSSRCSLNRLKWHCPQGSILSQRDSQLSGSSPTVFWTLCVPVSYICPFCILPYAAWQALLRCITGKDRAQRIASHRDSVTCFTREPWKLSAESSITSCCRTVAGGMHPGTLTSSASGMSPVLLSVRLTASHELSVCWGFSVDASGKEPACQCRKHKRRGFDPWVGKILWQPTPVFLPGEFHGQRSLASCSPWGGKELDATEAT